MPTQPLNTAGLAKILDSKSAAVATAKAIHGQDAAIAGNSPLESEAYLHSGKVFIDRVEGDEVHASWVLPVDGGWHRVAKLRLLVGTGGDGFPQYLCYINDSSGSTSVCVCSAHQSGGYGPALKVLWGKLFEDPWATLIPAAPSPEERAAGDSYSSLEDKAFYLSVLSLVVQVLLMVMIVVDSVDRQFWEVFRLEHLAIGIASTIGVLTVLQVLRHNALGRMASALRKKVQKALAGGKL